MKKILGLGNALTDILLQVSEDDLRELGFPKGSMNLISKDQAEQIQYRFLSVRRRMVAGGSASNTINCIAALGGKAAFIGKIGNDEVGDFYREDMIRNGVKPILLLSSMNAMSRLAKEAGCMVSLDLASYNVINENHAFLKKLVKQYVDIVFANEDESFAYTHLNPEESVQMIAEQCDIAVVKVGKNGSYVQQGSKRVHIGAITTSCTDSTGAGDYFAGGFLHALADGFDIRRCAEIGTIAAGRVVEVVGTKLPDEQWEEIRRICALYRGFMQKYDKD